MTNWYIDEYCRHNVVYEDGKDIAFFQRESDAARCVDAMNEAGRLREALESAQRELENCYDALKRHLRLHDRNRCLCVMNKVRAALVKESSDD